MIIMPNWNDGSLNNVDSRKAYFQFMLTSYVITIITWPKYIICVDPLVLSDRKLI